MDFLNSLLRIFWMAGPFLIPQLLLLAVIGILALVNVVRLLLGTEPRRLVRSVDAVLFWGAVTAVIGFLGTWSGLLKAFQALRRYGLASPQAMFMGLSEAHITTAFGLGVLILSGVLWFGFKVWLERPS